MYLILKGELAKRNISIKELSELLGLHRNTVALKINGNSEFTISEAFEIKDAFFPDIELRELFRKTKN